MFDIYHVLPTSDLLLKTTLFPFIIKEWLNVWSHIFLYWYHFGWHTHQLRQLHFCEGSPTLDQAQDFVSLSGNENYSIENLSHYIQCY